MFKSPKSRRLRRTYSCLRRDMVSAEKRAKSIGYRIRPTLEAWAWHGKDREGVVRKVASF